MIVVLISMLITPEAIAKDCPKFNSGSVSEWFYSIDDYEICNNDEKFLQTISSEYAEVNNKVSRDIIGGTLMISPSVFGIDALSKTSSFRHHWVESLSWKNENLSVRAYLCERSQVRKEFVGSGCSGNPRNTYTDVNLIGKTMELAHSYGIEKYYSYLQSDIFDPSKAREIQSIYDKAAKKATSLCAKESLSCSFIIIASN